MRANLYRASVVTPLRPSATLFFLLTTSSSSPPSASSSSSFFSFYHPFHHQTMSSSSSSSKVPLPPPHHPLLSAATRAKLFQIADLRTPASWYPAARSIAPRKIILHVGPTNSGKTYKALQALKQSSTGVYAGPLRLLAWEVYEKLNESGTPCALLTGQEREDVEGASHTSATIEMMGTSMANLVDVAVLDEIQMLADRDRGWSWSRALLGIPAHEVHCCGDPAAVPLVKQLLRGTRDSIEVHTYTRLSPLVVAKEHIKSFSELRRGDCVVAFGRRQLYKHKKEIEKTTGLKVGMIYGALPPAVRREQAKRFNVSTSTSLSSSLSSEAGSSSSSSAAPPPPPPPPAAAAAAAAAAVVPLPTTDILVATDAVGMGLNLNIQRIVFSTVQKFDGISRRPLTISEMKQIGGRAGRFSSVYPTGTVTGMASQDVRALSRAMPSVSPSIQTAGLLPLQDHIEAFAAALSPAWLLDEYTAKYVKTGSENDEEQEKVSSVSSSSSDDELAEARTFQSTSTSAESAASHPLSRKMMMESESEREEEEDYELEDALLYASGGGRGVDQLHNTEFDLVLAQQQTSQPQQNKTLPLSATVARIMPISPLLTTGSITTTHHSHHTGFSFPSASSMPDEVLDGVLPYSTILDLFSKYAIVNDEQAIAAMSEIRDAEIEEEEMEQVAHAEEQEKGERGEREDYYYDEVVAIDDIVRGRRNHSYSNNDTKEGGSKGWKHQSKTNVKNNKELLQKGSHNKKGSVSDNQSFYSPRHQHQYSSIPSFQNRHFTMSSSTSLPRSSSLSSVSKQQLQPPLYFLCDLSDAVRVAKLLDEIPLPFRVRYSFCLAPVDIDDPLVVTALRRYARKFVEKGKVKVALRIPSTPPTTPEELEELESAHAVFDLYIWLARKFPVEFIELEAAQQASKETQSLIMVALEKMGDKYRKQGKLQRLKQEAEVARAFAVQAQQKAQRLMLVGEAEYDDEGVGEGNTKMELEEEEEEDDVEEVVVVEDAERRSGNTSPSGSGDRDGSIALLKPSVPSFLFPEEVIFNQSKKNKHKVSSLSSLSFAIRQHLPSDVRREAELRRLKSRAQARHAARIAESLVFAAAAKGTLKSLPSDPEWKEAMSKIEIGSRRTSIGGEGKRENNKNDYDDDDYGNDSEESQDVRGAGIGARRMTVRNGFKQYKHQKGGEGSGGSGTSVVRLKF